MGHQRGPDTTTTTMRGMPMPEPVVAALHRFPIKGLSPEALDGITLAAGSYFPGDRLFAIENGPSGFDEQHPVHLPKTKFLMLQRDERLALLRTHYEPAGHRLTVRLGGDIVCDADLSNEAGRAALERFIAGFMGPGRAPPRLRAGRNGFSFTDSRKGYVSLVNLGSLRAVEEALGRPVDPLRFRANLAVEGLDRWAENDWLGRRLRVGGATLQVVALTERCAATGVDPGTGARDLNIVKTLVKQFGQNVFGVYASVLEGGTVRPRDPVILVA